MTYEVNPSGFEGDGHGIVPIGTPFALARGSAMHLYIEGWNKGWNAKQLETKIKESGIEPKALAVGKAMFAAFKNRYELDDRFRIETLSDLGIRDRIANSADFLDTDIASEVQFELDLPGSPHKIVGRMDEIVNFDGKLYLGDYKSANAKASENKKKTEFQFSSQPLFYLNAAAILGLDVAGMLYRVVTEHTPPQHYVIPIKRTKQQLNTAVLAIHQTAEEIQMLKSTFGTEISWPHFPNTYPCNYEFNGKSACEYADICNIPSSQLGETELERFKVREDHLGLKD